MADEPQHSADIPNHLVNRNSDLVVLSSTRSSKSLVAIIRRASTGWPSPDFVNSIPNRSPAREVIVINDSPPPLSMDRTMSRMASGRPPTSNIRKRQLDRPYWTEQRPRRRVSDTARQLVLDTEIIVRIPVTNDHHSDSAPKSPGGHEATPSDALFGDDID